MHLQYWDEVYSEKRKGGGGFSMRKIPKIPKKGEEGGKKKK